MGGPELIAYDWSPRTGVATLTYRNADGSTFDVERRQPTDPRHEGWSDDLSVLRLKYGR